MRENRVVQALFSFLIFLAFMALVIAVKSLIGEQLTGILILMVVVMGIIMFLRSMGV